MGTCARFTFFASRTTFVVTGLLSLGGCFHPGMYYGRPYGQPMYSPPQMINQATPGTLTIPERDDEYIPGESDYDKDPDDFRKSNNDKFFNPDGNVPLPTERRSPFMDEDIPTGSLFPDNSVTVSAARPASHSAHSHVPIEYGFDTAEYSWLRGLLQQDESTGDWFVVYSRAESDRLGGVVKLQVTREQLGDLAHGSPVIVKGTPEASSDAVASYAVDSIRLVSTRIAL